MYTSICMSTASTQPRTPSDEVAGLVERVTFFYEENGFAVLRVKIRGQRDLVTVLGSLPSVSAGEWLTAKGEVAGVEAGVLSQSERKDDNQTQE
jgi:hypothetical protein